MHMHVVNMQLSLMPFFYGQQYVDTSYLCTLRK